MKNVPGFGKKRTPQVVQNFSLWKEHIAKVAVKKTTISEDTGRIQRFKTEVEPTTKPAQLKTVKINENDQYGAMNPGLIARLSKKKTSSGTPLYNYKERQAYSGTLTDEKREKFTNSEF